MSYVDNQLMPGEQVIYRVNQGRKWHHYLMEILAMFVYGPILLLIFFSIPTSILRDYPMPGAADPMLERSLSSLFIVTCLLGPSLLLALLLAANFIHFLQDDLAITDTRIVGRWTGIAVWAFRKVNLSFAEIRSIESKGLSHLVIEIADGNRPIRLAKFKDRQKFAEEYRRITAHALALE